MEMLHTLENKNSKIFLIFFLFFISCKQTIKNKEFVEGKYVGFGKFIDGKRDGKFIFKYPSGKISSLETYKDDEALEQIFFYETGDTEAVAINGFFRSYFKNNKIETIQKSKFIDGKPLGIFFDSVGRVINLNCNLDFLTKSDTLHLNKDYPNWMEQVKEWEIKNGKK